MRVFMKNIILVIGEEIRYDAALMSYISRSYEQVFGRMDDLKFLSENDKVLPFALEKMIDSYDFITIFAANSAYAVVGKILSTLSFDSLELKNGETLAPSMARAVARGPSAFWVASRARLSRPWGRFLSELVKDAAGRPSSSSSVAASAKDVSTV